jgi:outer membrane receptor for ferrienterochelin and colicin
LRAAKLQGVAVLALSIFPVSSALAQDENSTPIEQVVVSSSRITSAGFNAPTPTTVLSADDIAKQAESNVFTTVTELPSLMGSTGTSTGNHGTSGGTNGLSSFGIHGVGTTRADVDRWSTRGAGANRRHS